MYQLQSSRRINPFAKFAHVDFHGAPTENQQLMMETVTRALKEGIFYSSEMFDYVTSALRDVLPSDNFITPEYLAKSIRTENGPLGRDIYNCRNIVEILLKRSANVASLETLTRRGIIALGKKIKGKFSFSGKNFASLTPVHIDDMEGVITFTTTSRGTKKIFSVTVGANNTSLLSGITSTITDNRVVEQKTCDGFTQYTIDPFANRQQELGAQIT